MDWTIEATSKLIELYHSNEILWNHSLTEYKNNNKKVDVLKEMSTSLGCDVPEVKKKIKNLRSQFHREHKMMYKTSSGQAAPAKTKWCFYASLCFLLSVDTPRDGTCTDYSRVEVSVSHIPMLHDFHLR